MKANGKNLKMFIYQTHDYMDMHPETSFRTAESQEVMNQFIEHMRTRWCSGTVSAASEVSPMEYFEARQSRYWRGYEDQLDNLAEDCDKYWLEEYNFYVEHKDYDTPALRIAWEERCHIEDMIADYCAREC